MLPRSIENFENQIKPCLCKKKMVMQSFFKRLLPRKRLKIISFLYSPLWLKTSQIFRHMANIFAFGDVASGQRQRWSFIMTLKENRQNNKTLTDSVTRRHKFIYGYLFYRFTAENKLQKKFEISIILFFPSCGFIHFKVRKNWKLSFSVCQCNNEQSILVLKLSVWYNWTCSQVPTSGVRNSCDWSRPLC